MANEKSANLQEVFLSYLREHKVPLTMFLVNGVKLQGFLTRFDNFSVQLSRDSQTQLLYKAAISTIMPMTPIRLYDGSDEEEAPAPSPVKVEIRPRRI